MTMTLSNGTAAGFDPQMAAGLQSVIPEAQKLLDFNQEKLDIALLDHVVEIMNTKTGEQQTAASQVLTLLKDHPDAWTRVDTVLSCSSNMNTKYYALQILQKVVQTRWKALPREQCDGIKNFVVNLVIEISRDETQAEQQKVYLDKLNLVLVQIVKQEWPKHWPTFISDIVGASRTNESLCKNNMKILKLLSEEVFDFSQYEMTSKKAIYLKQTFCGEFSAVYQLCQFVMENSESASLIEATLETLLKFLNWIPVGYIFETSLLDVLTTKFLPHALFRNVTLKCLVEASAVTVIPFWRQKKRQEPDGQDAKYVDKLVMMYMTALRELHAVLKPDIDIAAAYNQGSDQDQKFIINLALFLCTFLKEHASLVEAMSPTDPELSGIVGFAEAYEQLAATTNTNPLIVSLKFLLKISRVEDVEVFKICLDYWNNLVADLYREYPFTVNTSHPRQPHLQFRDSVFAPMFGGLKPTDPSNRASGELIASDNCHLRRDRYSDTLSELRHIMISRMAKPEEVLVVENEHGEIVREQIKDTDAINLYKTMRETLVYLTHLNYSDTEKIMTEKLHNQVNGTEWSWRNLNTLCWAIGSISGTMIEEDEKRFLVNVIRDLLGLCEQKRGKCNKAVIASNIMYVVGQYPRFLRAHWKFLKTVVNKLFEFMHETHEGVQDMACDTFIKIAQKCRRHFVIVQVGEITPFIDELLENLNSIICDLTPAQVQVFYEATGYIISAQTEDRQTQEVLLKSLMSSPNAVWDEAITQASHNVEILRDDILVKSLLDILKTNVAACQGIGNGFLPQLTRIYLDMLNVYKVTSENISNAVAQHGEAVLKQRLIKLMRGVKTESLRLIGRWVERSADDTKVVLDNFVPPLFDAVLFDYQRNVPAAREPEVLVCITAIVNKLKHAMSPEIPRVLDAVFQCTLEMINKDFQEYPEHRLNFFLLLRAINRHCFPVLVELAAEQMQLIIDSIVWAFKHSMRNVAEIGLEVLYQLLLNVGKNSWQPSSSTESPAAAGKDSNWSQKFYQAHLVALMEHVLSVVTDSSQAQVAGLTYYAEILGVMFAVVEDDKKLWVPLNPTAPEQSNVDYVYQYVGSLLKNAFPHLSDDQIRVTIEGFYSYNNDAVQLKNHLRDFLVQIKEFNGNDTTDLFLEEREKEIRDAQNAKKSVPGLLNPNWEGMMLEEPTTGAAAVRLA